MIYNGNKSHERNYVLTTSGHLMKLNLNAWPMLVVHEGRNLLLHVLFRSYGPLILSFLYILYLCLLYLQNNLWHIRETFNESLSACTHVLIFMYIQC